MTACAWCEGPIPAEARADSVFCGKKCRQRAWRLRGRRAELEERPQRAARPMRMAYADPPYPGLARRYYKDEASFAGEVDHLALITRLGAYDGWALSTGEYALRDLLPLCPHGARLLPWVKPMRPGRRTYGVQTSLEYLIVVPGRRLRPATRGWLYAAPARLGGSTLKGRKPLAFCAWLFGCLGLLPGDELEDLFPGSRTVTRAWAEVTRAARVGSTRSSSPRRGTTAPSGQDLVLPARSPMRRAQYLGDPSPATSARRVAASSSATRRPAPARDASRGGRRRRVPLGLVVDT